MKLPDAWLRVFVREAPRVGLREDVQELLPNALEVRIDPDMVPDTKGAQMAQRAGPLAAAAVRRLPGQPRHTPRTASASSSTSCTTR